MSTVAYLTSADMVPGQPDAREDLFELEHQLASLLPACASRGIRLDLRVWDDPDLLKDIEDGRYQAVVIGTPWDYQERAELFCELLERHSTSVSVLNPPAVVRWNSDKSYLRELERAGVAIVPTVWVDAVQPAAIDAAHEQLGADRLVVKPIVGACAVRQVTVRRGEPLPPPDECPPAGALVQPFMPSIQTEGELSFLFFGGRFSHALVKAPAAGDYRVQSVYGGVEQVYRPSEDELLVAQAAVAAVPGVRPEDLLIARVDLVRDEAGVLRLMELELIEPYLYPEQGPQMGEVFAEALASVLQPS